MASLYTEDNLIKLFDEFCTHYSHISQELIDRSEDVKQALSDKNILIKAKDALQAECAVLHETVDQCHKHLELICELEEEVRKLKEDVSNKEKVLNEQVSQHGAELKTLSAAHTAEIESTKDALQKAHDKEMSALKEELQQALQSKTDLEDLLKQAQAEKEREVHKVTMEYESKLMRLQRQQAQSQQQQQRMVNQDIMRKKMHFMKEQADRELESLKAYIAELERKQGISNLDKEKDGGSRIATSNHEMQIIINAQAKNPKEDNGPTRQKRRR